jgi:capsule polysaccharide export protein KpsE/RkpR
MRHASEAIERQLLVQQVGYLDDAVRTTEVKLEVDELVLKEFCLEHKVIDPGMQSADRLRHIRELTTSRDEAISQRVQRLVHFTESDPVVRQLDANIETKNKRIEQLRSSFAGDSDQGEYGLLLIELEGLRQRVRYRRDLLSTLSTQAEVYRIRADQPAGNLAVIRPAVAISRPAGPSRKKTYGLALGGSIMLAVFLALLLDQVVLIRREPLLSAKLGELRATALRRPRFSLPFRRSALELP